MTGKRSTLRPFIMSAIAINGGVRAAFDEIAAAGGGKAVTLELGAAPPLPAGGREGGRGEGAGRGARRDSEPARPRRNRAAEQIAEHVLLLSFGAGHEARLREFVRVFFEYRRAGAFD